MIYVKSKDEISEYEGGDVLIFPLKKEELELLKEDSSLLGKYLNIEYDGEDFNSEIMKGPFESQYKLLISDEKNWVYHTFWVIVSLPYRKIIGSICFKSAPINGCVEIGYGISPKYFNKGYTTCAVKLIVDWAFKNGVQVVKAEALKSNLASIRVLEKNNFVKTCEDKNLCYFERKM